MHEALSPMATDAEEQAVLHKKIERMRTQQEQIERGIAFLQEHSERKRVHLTDPDADWQKGNTGTFIVGYNARMAVDAATNMIVHQEVVTQQADSTHTLAMIAGVEAVKESADTIAKQTTSDAPTRQADTQPTGQDGNRSVEQAVDHSAPSEVKYILDSGYSCHTNLDALTDTDVYMPDTEFASICLYASACTDYCMSGTACTSVRFSSRRAQIYCLPVSVADARETEERTRKTDLCAALSRCRGHHWGAQSDSQWARLLEKRGEAGANGMDGTLYCPQYGQNHALCQNITRTPRDPFTTHPLLIILG